MRESKKILGFKDAQLGSSEKSDKYLPEYDPKLIAAADPVVVNASSVGSAGDLLIRSRSLSPILSLCAILSCVKRLKHLTTLGEQSGGFGRPYYVGHRLPVDVSQPDRKVEAAEVFGTTSPIHRGVDYLLNKGKPLVPWWHC